MLDRFQSRLGASRTQWRGKPQGLSSRALAPSPVRAVLALAGLALLCGCGHMRVTDLGDGRHSLTASSPTGGYSGSHEEVLEAANDFCHKSRQGVVIDHFDDAPEVGPRGEHTSNLVFKCAPATVLNF
jgi:hypothetical protein